MFFFRYAVISFNWLSFTFTGLLSGVCSIVQRFKPHGDRKFVQEKQQKVASKQIKCASLIIKLVDVTENAWQLSE